MNKLILGGFEEIRVRVCRRENGAREKKKKEKRSGKMAQTGPSFFYVCTQTGPV